MGFDLYIFDFDGTLVDTRQDMTSAVNVMLTHYGLETKSVPEVTSYVGDGIKKLVERCIGSHDVDIKDAVSRFNRAYASHLLDTTVTYPGVYEVLDNLKDKYRAILTNKSYDFTKIITDALALTSYFSLIIGGDTLKNKKPNPEGVEHILKESGIKRGRTCMIGDGINDILMAKGAGIKSIYAKYGYTDVSKIKDEQPDYIIDNPLEILKL